MNAPIKTEDSFHQLIHQNHMWGLWEIASQMTPHPRPEAIAHQWKWSLLKEVVKQSATAVPVGDERRAMQLFNPGLNGAWATKGFQFGFRRSDLSVERTLRTVEWPMRLSFRYSALK